MGKYRRSDGRKYYLSKLPADTDLKALTAAIEAALAGLCPALLRERIDRQAREQARQQLKELDSGAVQRPRPRRRPLPDRAAPPRADGHDRLRLYPAPADERGEVGAKTQRSTAPAELAGGPARHHQPAVAGLLAAALPQVDQYVA